MIDDVPRRQEPRFAGLVAERLNRGLSVRDAAEAIGVNVDVLSGAERGVSCPQPRHAKAIADFYGFQVTEIWPVEARPVAAGEKR